MSSLSGKKRHGAVFIVPSDEDDDASMRKRQKATPSNYERAEHLQKPLGNSNMTKPLARPMFPRLHCDVEAPSQTYTIVPDDETDDASEIATVDPLFKVAKMIHLIAPLQPVPPYTSMGSQPVRVSTRKPSITEVAGVSALPAGRPLAAPLMLPSVPSGTVFNCAEKNE